MERAVSLVIFFIIGLGAQFVDGSIGMGYGAFSASFLIGMGIMPALASASIHTAEICVSLFSGVSHLRFGNVKKDWLLLLVIPGAIGGAAGAYFLASIPGSTIKPFIAGFLFLMGVVVLYRFSPLKKASLLVRIVTVLSHPKVSAKKIAVLGLIAAFLDAVGGGGWGPIATPGLILTENEEPRKVIGTINMAEFFITIVISVTFFVVLGLEEYDWTMIGMLLVGGAIAAPIAAYLCKKLPVRLLGILVGLALVGFNIRTILEVIL
jgi:uncharacterized membrane protein YfcA